MEKGFRLILVYCRRRRPRDMNAMCYNNTEVTD